MAELYLWTPWDVLPEGTMSWPADFRRIQQDWKASPSARQTSNVHSLQGIGRIVVVSGPESYIADHLGVPGVVNIGASLMEARSWVESGRHARTAEFASHFERTLAPQRQMPSRDLAALIARFLPDQLRRPRTSQRSGTFTETWTGTNGDPWSANWSTVQMDTLDVNLGGNTATFEIQANEGEVRGPTGGASVSNGHVAYYNGETAADQNVKLDWVAKPKFTTGPAVRIENGGGFDSLYVLDNHSQLGDDTRLFKIVDETRTEEATSGVGAETPTFSIRLVVENDASGDPALDGTAWTGTEPGTPSISHTDTEIDAITGAGFGGIYFIPGRDSIESVDNFEFTNNDAPPAGAVRRRSLSSLGVGR